MFGLFKKKYPVITSDMIQPEDNLITTTEAKRLYKAIMREIGFITDGRERSDNVRYLGDAIKGHQEYLYLCISEKQNEIKYTNNEIAKLKKRLKQSDNEDQKYDIENDINDRKLEIKSLENELIEAKSKLGVFKKDKRSFLIEYINFEVHGTEMTMDF